MNPQQEIENLKKIIDKQHEELQYFKEQFKILNEKLNEKKEIKDKYWWKQDKKLFDKITKYINRSKKNMTQEPDSWLRINVWQSYPVKDRINLNEKDKKRILKYIVNELKN